MFQKKTKEPAGPDLTAVITKAGGILDARKRNRDAAVEARRQLGQAETVLADQRKLLAESEADIATGGQPADSKAASRYRDARDQVELLTIRLEGLGAAYADLGRQLIEVEADVAAERRAFFEREVAAFEATYIEAATAFAAVLRRAEALGSALDFTFSNIQGLNVPATLYRDSMKLHVAGVPRSWKDDPTAAAIYERLLPRLELNNNLKREIAGVKRQADETEMFAARQRQNEHFKNGRQTTVLTIEEPRNLDQERADRDARSLNEAMERMRADCRPAPTDQEAA